MHQSSYDEMASALRTHLGDRWRKPLRLADIGSRSVNVSFPHTYRELISPAWTYVGFDAEAGSNVDYIMHNAYEIPAEPKSFDAVLCGQCLEHVPRFWRLVREMARIVRPGGLVILTAPWQWEIHRYPVDCYRFLPDGMEGLIADAELDVVAAWLNGNDCWGIGRKPALCSSRS